MQRVVRVNEPIALSAYFELKHNENLNYKQLIKNGSSHKIKTAQRPICLAANQHDTKKAPEMRDIFSPVQGAGRVNDTIAFGTYF